MGLATEKISVKDLFVGNRERLISRLQETLAAAQALVYLRGGPSAERFDTDHEPIFRQESYFQYLTGVKEPDCSVLIDVQANKTILLIPRLPPEYATIMGKIRTPDEWRDLYLVDEVRFNDETHDILQQEYRIGNTTNGHTAKTILLMKGTNSDSGNTYEPPADFVEKYASNIDIDTLFPILANQRVTKSPSELSVLRYVTEVTSFAHAYVMRNMKPGMAEYQGEVSLSLLVLRIESLCHTLIFYVVFQSLFRHYCYFNYGCRLVGYTPICGCGPNSAILHYGHAGEPNSRLSQAGDTCLFDMGCEYFCYGSDVTCSFPITGKFDDRQRPVYTAVLNAQVAVYNMLRPGVSWVDCHKTAELEILRKLSEIGLVVPGDKTLEELVELRLGAVFMPHGLGHFIGLDTHDVGGYLKGYPDRIPKPGLKSLRTARILEETMTLTVEPGCYFIDHLLDEALAQDSPLRAYLDERKLAEYRGFGGVRLEDVVVITAENCINFTLCPRTIEEVEAVMQGGKWPPYKDTAPELRRQRLTDPTPLPSPPSL